MTFPGDDIQTEEDKPFELHHTFSTSHFERELHVHEERSGEARTDIFTTCYIASKYDEGWRVGIPGGYIQGSATWKVDNWQPHLDEVSEERALAFITEQEFILAQMQGEQDFAAYIRRVGPESERSHIAHVLYRLDREGRFPLDDYRPVSAARQLTKLRKAGGNTP